MPRVTPRHYRFERFVRKRLISFVRRTYELKLGKLPKVEEPPVGEALGSEASDFMLTANAWGRGGTALSQGLQTSPCLWSEGGRAQHV